MLILASHGFRSPIVCEKLKKLVDPTGKSVLIIPFAGFEPRLTAELEASRGLIPFGFSRENIFVCNIFEAEKYFKETPDYIYVPGGDVFRLLSELHGSGILPLLKSAVQNGSTYIGISSGADLCCEDLSYLKEVEDDNYMPKSYLGLGLIGENILCHADQRDMGTIMRCRQYFPEKKLLLLRNDEVYIVD